MIELDSFFHMSCNVGERFIQSVMVNRSLDLHGLMIENTLGRPIA